MLFLAQHNLFVVILSKIYLIATAETVFTA